MDFFSFPQTRHTPQIQSRLRLRVGDVFWTILISGYQVIRACGHLCFLDRRQSVIESEQTTNKTSIPIIPPRLIHTLHTENPCFRHPKQIITCRSFKTQWYVVSWWFNGVKQVWNVFPVFNGSDVNIYSAFRTSLKSLRLRKLLH